MKTTKFAIAAVLMTILFAGTALANPRHVSRRAHHAQLAKPEASPPAAKKEPAHHEKKVAKHRHGVKRHHAAPPKHGHR